MSELLPLGADFSSSPEILRAETLYLDDERSVAVVAVNGINRKTINHLSDTNYRVIVGTGLMHLPRRDVELTPGTSVNVRANTPYYDEGSLIMIATSTPPFDPESVETLDDDTDIILNSPRDARRKDFLGVIARVLSEGAVLEIKDITEIALHYGYRPSTSANVITSPKAQRILKEEHGIHLFSSRHYGQVYYTGGAASGEDIENVRASIEASRAARGRTQSAAMLARATSNENS